MIQRSIQRVLARVRQPEKLPALWNWPLGVGLAVAYLIVLFAALLFTTSAADTPLDGSPEPGVLAWSNLIGCALTGVLIYQYVSTAFYNAQDSKKIPLQTRLANAMGFIPSQNTPLAFVALAAFTIVVLVDVVSFIVGVPFDSLPRPLLDLSLEEDLGQFIIGLLVVVIARPIIEEIIFRGILYPALVKKMDAVQAVGITALVFALVHFVLDSSLWWGLVYPLLLGLTAGIARGATKSTYAAILTHLMFGLFIMLRAIIL